MLWPMSDTGQPILTHGRARLQAARPLEILRAVFGRWCSYANALICRSRRRPSLQLIP